MADPLAITLHADGSESATGSSAAQDIGALRSAVLVDISITVVPGGETLTVDVESAPKSTGPWTSHGTLLSSDGAAKKVVAETQRYVRCTWALSGAGPVEFSAQGSAEVTYARIHDLENLGVAPGALADVSEETKVRALIRSTADASAALGTRWALPISDWGEDLVGRVATRAIYYSFRHRGFDPDRTVDSVILNDGGLITPDGQPTAVERWFRDIGRGIVHPEGIVDSTPSKREMGARVRSKNTLREW